MVQFCNVLRVDFFHGSSVSDQNMLLHGWVLHCVFSRGCSYQLPVSPVILSLENIQSFSSVSLKNIKNVVTVSLKCIFIVLQCRVMLCHVCMYMYAHECMGWLSQTVRSWIFICCSWESAQSVSLSHVHHRSPPLAYAGPLTILCGLSQEHLTAYY